MPGTITYSRGDWHCRCGQSTLHTIRGAGEHLRVQASCDLCKDKIDFNDDSVSGVSAKASTERQERIAAQREASSVGGAPPVPAAPAKTSPTKVPVEEK